MRQYLTLVRLFSLQLIRRKSLWIVIVLVGIICLVNVLVARQMSEMTEQGMRYEIATRKATQALDSYASQIKGAALALAMVAAALVAPGSRKDGTSQFVLTLSVSRNRLALGQFGALVSFLFVGALVIHMGYSVAAYRLGTLDPLAALLGWLLLFVALVVAATPCFVLSLTRPALAVYGVLLAVPYVLLPLVSSFATWDKLPALLRTSLGRFADNWKLLFFPSLFDLLPWPRLGFAAGATPLMPGLGLEIAQTLLAVSFWVVVGLWAYGRYDLGSRLPTK